MIIVDKIKRTRGIPESSYAYGKKGISLPMNVLIVVAIAVVAVVAIGAFFFSASFGTISDTEAQRVFGTGCVRYCHSDLYSTFKGAYDASRSDSQFVAACVKLGYGDSQHVNRCLEGCTNCNLIVTQDDINQGLDNLNALTTRG